MASEEPVEADPPDAAVVVSALEPKLQAAVITISSILIFGFVAGVHHLYGRYVHIPSLFYGLDIGTILVAVLILWVLTPIIEQFIRALRRWGRVPDPEKPVGIRQLDWLSSNLAMNVIVWVMSSAQFFLLGYLVLKTGGLVSSPYSAILTTFLALAPYAMNGANSILILWFVGIGYLTLLDLWHPGQHDLTKPLPPSGMYTWVIAGTVTIAMLLNWAIKRVQWGADHERNPLA